MPNIIVKRSKIHGKGVFANRDFKKGEIAVKYHLKPLSEEEFNSLSKSEKRFTSFEDGKYWLFPSPERYVNHSCSPNAATNLKAKHDAAIKEIKKGEEILIDYSSDNIPGLNMKCKCGSKNCKKVIKNE